MFNLSGSEIVFLLIIALVVLGPEKLPDAVRKFGRFYGEFKRMSSGFQSELRSAFDEPMKEMRETADAMRKAANLDFEPTRVDGDTGKPAADRDAGGGGGPHRRAGSDADVVATDDPLAPPPHLGPVREGAGPA